MADTAGQKDIRGRFDITELMNAFDEEENIFLNHIMKSNVPTREFRYWQKTAGYLSPTAPLSFDNQAELTLPFVAEQTLTLNTAYVRIYKEDTAWVSIQDINDSPVDVWAMTLREAVKAINRRRDSRIYDVISESQTAVNINSVVAVAAWGASSGVNILKDIMAMKTKLRQQGFSPDGKAVLALDALQHQFMLEEFINTRGSSFPGFSSELIKNGVVDLISNIKVIVSENVVSGSAMMWMPNRTASWKEFTALQNAIIEEPLLGKKIRVVTEGECILHTPKSACILTSIGA